MSPLQSAQSQLTRRQSFGLVSLAFSSGACSPPEQAGSKATVGQSLSDPIARRFYELRGWQAAWSPALAQSLQGAIAGARGHGLSSSGVRTTGSGHAILLSHREEQMSLRRREFINALGG